MRREDIRDDVKTFIAEHVGSVVQLEVLILLQRQPAHAWTPEEVARELRVDAGWTASELARLAGRGFVAVAGRPPTYRYAPPADVAPAIAGLVDAYGERRVTVINLIYSRPSDAIRSFADAFRLRKD